MFGGKLHPEDGGLHPGVDFPAAFQISVLGIQHDVGVDLLKVIPLLKKRKKSSVFSDDKQIFQAGKPFVLEADDNVETGRRRAAGGLNRQLNDGLGMGIKELTKEGRIGGLMLMTRSDVENLLNLRAMGLQRASGNMADDKTFSAFSGNRPDLHAKNRRINGITKMGCKQSFQLGRIFHEGEVGRDIAMIN